MTPTPNPSRSPSRPSSSSTRRRSSTTPSRSSFRSGRTTRRCRSRQVRTSTTSTRSNPTDPETIAPHPDVEYTTTAEVDAHELKRAVATVFGSGDGAVYVTLTDGALWATVPDVEAVGTASLSGTDGPQTYTRLSDELFGRCSGGSTPTRHSSEHARRVPVPRRGNPPRTIVPRCSTRTSTTRSRFRSMPNARLRRRATHRHREGRRSFRQLSSSRPAVEHFGRRFPDDAIGLIPMRTGSPRSEHRRSSPADPTSEEVDVL